MENFILTIAATITAAIIIGLPALAFKSPDFYEDFIGNKPYYVVAFCLIAYLSWAVGAEMTLNALTPEQLKNESLKSIISFTSATAVTMAQVIAFISYAYLEGLIGSILRHHKFKSISVKK